MCGIAGFTFADQALIQRMTQTLAHRGPDAAGVHVEGAVSLGHRRLAIIDTSVAANQPLQTPDGRYTIVYNGEIYNFKELRQELGGKYDFTTTSDTEVVLAAFACWGSACFEKLNGIFSLAIWDAHKRELTLTRDRAGVKPLYYIHNDTTLWFASEAKALLKTNTTHAIDPLAAQLYFRLLYVPGSRTMWKDIKKVRPGEVLCVQNGAIKHSFFCFGSSERQVGYGSKQEWQDAVRETVVGAVQRQLVADVPVGLFLSGGIDSTIIAHAMREYAGGAFHTFSARFAVHDQADKYNEDAMLARMVAQRIGSTHHEVTIQGSDVPLYFEQVVAHMDEPVANPIQITNYILAKKAAQHVPVVLGGDGADELFGGYDRYYYAQLVEYWQKVPKVLRSNAMNRFFAHAMHKGGVYEKLNAEDGFSLWWQFMAQKNESLNNVIRHTWNKTDAAKQYLQKELWPIVDSHKPLPRQLMHMDEHSWLVDESLIRSDKMGMAWGLEQRVPFLDNEIVALARGIPVKYLLDSAHQGKLLLREAFQDVLPPEVYNKHKTGWFSPMAKWLRTDAHEFAQSVISPDYVRGTDEYINFTAAQKMLDDHVAGKAYALAPLWALITFQVWYKTYCT